MDNSYIPNLLAATHPAFRELAEYIWKEHLKRRPEIDSKMNPLRMKAWLIWDANLPVDHARKGIQPPRLLTL
jgi:hypothetical protein